MLLRVLGLLRWMNKFRFLFRNCYVSDAGNMKVAGADVVEVQGYQKSVSKLLYYEGK